MDEVDGADDYAVYGDRSAPEPTVAGRPRDRAGMAAPTCPWCGSHDDEEGFVEGTRDSQVRYYTGERATGLFGGVKRLGLDRRAVLARRCLGCSRLELFADDLTD